MMNRDEETDDIDFEPEDELGDIASAKAKLKKLRDELVTVKEERQEYLTGWQRAKADTINARQEMAREADARGARAAENLIDEIIPVLDSFDMATGSPAWESIAPEWRSGMDHIRNQLLEVLSRSGYERFGKLGEPFDPNLHEAVQEMDDVAGESHSIVRILRYGYKKGTRILRPAQVIVKK